MKYKHPFQKKTTHSQIVKATAYICGHEIFPDVKMPRKERSDVGQRRKKYNQPERELRADVMKYLRKKKIKFYRIENGLPGYRGLPDFLFFAPPNLFFMELKATTDLRTEQKQFKAICDECLVNYIVIRDVNELKVIV